MSENQTASESPEPSTPTPRTRAIKTRSINEAQDAMVPVAVDRRSPDRLARALEHARLAARIAEDNRAKDIQLLDLRQVTPLLDYFVIATATSRRQANAIAIEIDAEMKKLGELKLGMEGSEEGVWILIDYGDFVVHVFSGDGRSYYALEEIWGDAPQIPLREGDPPVAAGSNERPIPAPEQSESELEPESDPEPESTEPSA
ncbi:ribosome silencing factor [Planctomyces sp. SH-PL62]|uniref:ribosome silencing factor n=1 Tax=Planctomyces sp. SH-PL62 TaxID=1636152 RepID=UPI00078DFFF2|nr:ribosome silencing factor [Planctomyces sp. SH-PL62]AMV39710.1 Ribosomal silencing factor RsfS [Planctomyces sp. SH-PL62]